MPLFHQGSYNSGYWLTDFSNLDFQHPAQFNVFLENCGVREVVSSEPSFDEDTFFAMDFADDSLASSDEQFKQATPEKLKDAFLTSIPGSADNATGLQLLLIKLPESSSGTVDLDNLYDAIIYPILFENNFSIIEIVSLIKIQCVDRVNEKILSSLLHKVWADIDKLVNAKRHPLKQIVESLKSSTETCKKIFLDAALSESGMLESLWHVLSQAYKNEDYLFLNAFFEEELSIQVSVNGLHAYYYDLLLREVFLPLVELLSLSNKIQLCVQWIQIVPGDKEFLLKDAVILPSLRAEQANLGHMPWNKISDNFIDDIIIVVRRNLSQLEIALLREIFANKPEYFSGRKRTILSFSQFRDVLSAFPVISLLKNCSTIISFIQKNFSHQDFKQLSSMFEPYDKLINLTWEEVRDDSIQALLNYAKETQNEDLEIAIFKGCFQHNILFFQNSEYKEILDILAYITKDNKYTVVPQFFLLLEESGFSQKINIEIINLLLQKIDATTFRDSIPWARLGINLIEILMAFAQQSQNRVLQQEIYKKISDVIVFKSFSIEEVQENLHKLLSLLLSLARSTPEDKSLSAQTVRIENICNSRTNKLTKHFSGIDLLFSFSDTIYNVVSEKITMLDFATFLQNVTFSPEEAFEFLHIMGTYATHSNFFINDEILPELYQQLALLANKALLSEHIPPQDTSELKFIKEAICYSNIFKEWLDIEFSIDSEDEDYTNELAGADMQRSYSYRVNAYKFQ